MREEVCIEDFKNIEWMELNDAFFEDDFTGEDADKVTEVFRAFKVLHPTAIYIRLCKIPGEEGLFVNADIDEDLEGSNPWVEEAYTRITYEDLFDPKKFIQRCASDVLRYSALYMTPDDLEFLYEYQVQIDAPTALSISTILGMCKCGDGWLITTKLPKTGKLLVLPKVFLLEHERGGYTLKKCKVKLRSDKYVKIPVTIETPNGEKVFTDVRGYSCQR